MILGIPNYSGAAPTISSTNPGTGSFTSFGGSMGPGQEVYGFLGLGAETNNSESFTNWAAADLSVNGIVANSFGIYVYTLSGPLAAKNAIDVTFSSDLALGTFAVGYGVSGDHAFSTPFTEAGLETGGGTPVPEPTSLILLGSGTAALGLWRRRKTKDAA